MTRRNSRVPAQLSMLAGDVSERGLMEGADLPDRRRWVDTIRSVRIATARYSNKGIVGSGLAPVRITRWPPRFRLPYVPFAMLELAPEAWMLKVAKEPKGKRKFTDAFAEQLAELDPGAVAEKLAGAATSAGLVLLCFEDLRVKGNYCHRQQVAAWLEATYRIEVAELPE